MDQGSLRARVGSSQIRASCLVPTGNWTFQGRRHVLAFPVYFFEIGRPSANAGLVSLIFVGPATAGRAGISPRFLLLAGLSSPP